MKTPLQIFGAAASVIFGLVVFAFVSTLTRVHLPPEDVREVTKPLADQALDAERPAATEIGMTLAEEGEAQLQVTADTGLWTQPIQLHARECVAVIAAVYGGRSPRALALQSVPPDNGRIAWSPVAPLAVTRSEGQVAAQVQWCEWEAHARTIVLETRSLLESSDYYTLPGKVHFAIYRGAWDRVGGFSRLRRGTFSSDALGAFPAEAAQSEIAGLVPAVARPLGGPIALTLDGARLIPTSAETYRALYERVRGDLETGVNPRVDPSQPPGVPWMTGLPLNLRELQGSLLDGHPLPSVQDAVIEAGPNTFRRTLAVIDRGRLGARCVTLVFTRALFGHAPNVRRYTPDRSERPVELESVGASARDTVCPAQGIALYTVPDTQQNPYTLRMYAQPESAREINARADGTPPESDEDATDERRSRHRRTRR